MPGRIVARMTLKWHSPLNYLGQARCLTWDRRGTGRSVLGARYGRGTER